MERGGASFSVDRVSPRQTAEDFFVEMSWASHSHALLNWFIIKTENFLKFCNSAAYGLYPFTSWYQIARSYSWVIALMVLF
jgi:hypothetical protein